ncbi:MAG: hypothetical protein COW85_12920, partial [Ignavibacteria bacterium CG22_combo_CG10-13_8_21_14_all_37_15]
MKFKFKTLYFLMVIVIIGYSQTPVWENYVDSKPITSLADEGNNLWVGTTGGLIKLDKSSGEKTLYNKGINGFPDNYINTITIDSVGNKWIGTKNGGVGKFDGTKWISYNTTNSALPNNNVTSIKIDKNGAIWFSTLGGGIAKYTGTDWTIFNTSNSPLPNNNIVSLVIDNGENSIWVAPVDAGFYIYYGRYGWTHYNVNNLTYNNDIKFLANGLKREIWMGTFGYITWFDAANTNNSGTFQCPLYTGISTVAVDTLNNKWVGTKGLGLAFFDGTNWLTYNSSNSGLPGNNITAIVIDKNGIKWIGTYDGGLVKYDGTNWEKYSTSSSELPPNRISALTFDKQGEKWIGTWGGG